MNWIIVDSGKRNATENMALDEALLLDLEGETRPILHFYDWENDSATYGYFVEPEKFLNMDGVAKHHLSLARRPTGGGIVFHNCDFAFSVLVPSASPFFSQNPLENYAFINGRVLKAIQQFTAVSPTSLLVEEPLALDTCCRHFCMAKPTKYDVMLGGKKVGGAAQRKTRLGYLHQGSIALGLHSDNYLKDILLPDTQVLAGMKQHTYPLLGTEWNLSMLTEARKTLQDLLTLSFTEVSK